MSIMVDAEFKALIPPLSPEEYSQLEENCVREGIRDPLVVWATPHGTQILVDGHNRWKIAAEHSGMHFDVVEKHFENRADAEAWIIKNQLGRRNLPIYVKAQLALQLKPLIAERAKEKQVEAGGAVRQKSDKAVIDTKKELARAAGVSHDTIHKVEVIERDATESIKQLARSGEISINKAYLSTVQPTKSHKQLMDEYVDSVQKEHEEFQEKKAESVVSVSEIRKDAQNRKFLANELYTRVTKAGKGLSDLYVSIHEGEVDLAGMYVDIDEEQRHSLRQTLKMWREIIDLIERRVNG